MTNEIEELRQQVRLLSDQISALSLVLHATIITANTDIDDFSEGVAQMLGDFASKQSRPLARSIMMEWTDVLRGIERPFP